MSKATLSNLYVSSFCREVSLFLKSGLHLEEGILLMVDDEKTKDIKAMLNKIYDSMSEEGLSFYDALLSVEVFPKYVTDMVLVGEKSGHLEKILDELSLYYRKEEELNNTIKGAVFYPAIMAGMMFVVLIVLVVKIIPMFTNIYYELGSDVPSIVTTIINAGNIISKIAIVILGVICIAFVISFIYKKANGGKSFFSIQEKFFSEGTTGRLISLSRFTSMMSLAMSAGLDIDYAIDLAEKTISHSEIKQKIKKCKEELDKGESFSDAIEKSEMIKGVYAGLLSTGFRTGSADTMLGELSDRYSQEADDRINSIVSSIEPTIVIIMTILVGIILLMVMMPLLGIISSIG